MSPWIQSQHWKISKQANIKPFLKNAIYKVHLGISVMLSQEGMITFPCTPLTKTLATNYQLKVNFAADRSCKSHFLNYLDHWDIIPLSLSSYCEEEFQQAAASSKSSTFNSIPSPFQISAGDILAFSFICIFYSFSI
jgi:hypothetical protein